MISRYNAAVDGTWLSEISDRVVITDVIEQPAAGRVETAGRAVGNGSRFIRSLRESLSVEIAFVIFEQDVARRKEILSRVQAWAAGEPEQLVRLETNDRPAQFLYARCTELPAADSAMRWLNELRVTFTAFERPYWIGADVETATITSSGSLYVPGTGRALCEAEIVNAGTGAITTVTVVAADTSITVSGLNLAAGRSLAISYDAYGRIAIKSGNTDALARRTPESSDDLLVTCGKSNDISVSTDGTAKATFKARGMYP